MWTPVDLFKNGRKHFEKSRNSALVHLNDQKALKKIFCIFYHSPFFHFVPSILSLFNINVYYLICIYLYICKYFIYLFASIFIVSFFVFTLLCTSSQSQFLYHFFTEFYLKIKVFL